MTQAKLGDTVTVNYTGKFDNGEVFDTSGEHDPLHFTIGDNNLLPGFEKAIIGMNPGETKIFKLLSNEAYGPRNQNLLFTTEKSIFPEGLELKIGQYWQIDKDNGQILNVQVTDVSDQTVTLDANHPLAGKDITFEVELVKILEQI
jgi:peptidylprolyl isomerase